MRACSRLGLWLRIGPCERYSVNFRGWGLIDWHKSNQATEAHQRQCRGQVRCRIWLASRQGFWLHAIKRLDGHVGLLPIVVPQSMYDEEQHVLAVG
jgi:hypothetical protein